MLIYCKGDLLLSKAHTIAHGCNCIGAMGAGIALQIKQRFPNMYEEYRNKCLTKTFIPGDYWLCKYTTPWVLNLATQYSTNGADINLIKKSLEAISNSYINEEIKSISMPLIGTGLGRIDESEVRNLMNQLISTLNIPIFVYHVYEKNVYSSEEKKYFSNHNQEGGEK